LVFLEIISNLKVYGEIGASEELYLQQNFGMNYLSDCMIIRINDDLEKVKEGKLMNLTKKNGFVVAEKKGQAGGGNLGRG
jgi:hypothetical protein